jgi:hypothetical protein
MRSSRRPPAIDPACPTSTHSTPAAILRALSGIHLGLSIVAALVIWYFFRTADVMVGVSSPIPFPQYEEQTNWTAIGLGFAVLLQGVLSYAVLQAVASITEDVTATRITAKRIARHFIESGNSE